MNTWNQMLTRLETRLRSLVEGSAAHLFPDDESMDLSLRLLKVMKSAVQVEADGDILAPNLYLLKVHPSEVSKILEGPSALQDLAFIIQQAGLEAGLKFNSPPTVKVSAHPGVKPGHLDIEARITPTHISTTRTLNQLPSAEQVGTIPPDAFLIVEGNRIFPLNQAVVNIGRRIDNHLTLEDPRVSRLHAQLRAIKGQYVLFDLNSTGGTFVNGEWVKEVSLQPGDVISLAGALLVFGQDSATFSGDTHGSTHPLAPYQHEG